LNVLGVGEILWDVFPDQELLGGAPLNFSVSMHRLGNKVAVLSAVGNDIRGRRALTSMIEWGIVTDFVELTSERGTGTAMVSTDASGNATFVIERPAAFDLVHLDELGLDRIRAFHPDWIYLGTLAHTAPGAEERLDHLLSVTPNSRCFYDINLREGHWNAGLVQRLSHRATIIKLNNSEAEELYRLSNCTHPYSIEAFCKYWSASFGGSVICVTLGACGCAIWIDETLHTFAAYPVTVVDTVGAGDAFAAAFLHGYQCGLPVDEMARRANALGALVASRAGAIPEWRPEECLQLVNSAH